MTPSELASKLREVAEDLYLRGEFDGTNFCIQAASEIERLSAELALRRDAPIQIQMHSQGREAAEKRAERYKEALIRAYDEGVHATGCGVRKGPCTCWVEEASEALRADEEMKS